jgi:hypothetical protein
MIFYWVFCSRKSLQELLGSFLLAGSLGAFFCFMSGWFLINFTWKLLSFKLSIELCNKNSLLIKL